MTCIAAIKAKDGIYMMADRQGTDEDEILIGGEPKIFIKDGMLLGYCGAFSDAQAVHYRFDFPERGVREATKPYLYGKWLPAYREFMNGEKRVSKPDDRSEREWGDSYALLAMDGEIFLLTSDFAAYPIASEFMAIGSGGPYAKGALHALKTKKPEARLQEALEIAALCSSTVSGPFDVLKLEAGDGRPG